VQGPCLLAHGYGLLAKIRLGQRRASEALRQASEGARLAASCDGGTLGSDTRNATAVVLQVLVAQSNWSAAMATLDETDRLAQNRPGLRGQVVYAVPRALAYAFNGRAAAALPVISNHLEARRRAIGTQHTVTALVQGVRGIVLASMPDEEQRAQARGELAAAVEVLASPGAPGHELLEQGEQAAISELIFERYLESLGPQPAAADAGVAFGIADLMRGSRVQRALNEAAARSAAQTAGLADIVRRDQGARNELDTLYAYVARHADDAEADRLEAVSVPVRSRIAELERTRADLRAQIARGFPEYGRLVAPAPPSPADVARQLGGGEVLVSIHATADHVHLWAVTSDGALAYRRADVDATRIAALVRRLRATLDVADQASLPSFDASAAADLYRFLMRPLAPALEGKTHLIVAANGALAQVPFGALLTGPATDLQAMPWLIRHAAVSQVPGAGAWLAAKRLARARRAAEPLAAWGDPLFGSDERTQPTTLSRRLQMPRAKGSGDGPEGDLARAAIRYAQIPPLPETRAELLAIAATLHADATRDVLLGDRATRASVLAMNRNGSLANKRVLVFATHGLIAGDLPGLDEPALALAATAREANDPLAALLTLDDVLELKLNADWVVLSACNTAAAEGQAQEALSGLARGFFHAGSRSLLVTHWAVETESAKLLTTGTLEHYSTHPSASKAESLRQAMLAVMALPQYAHPAFWAPFALAGDGAR
jgi:CHAT domain-containing protein